MRIGFMLLSLLIVVGIMLFVYKEVSIPEVQQGQITKQEAQQLSGHDVNGAPAYKTYKATAHLRGTQYDGMEITDVTDGGAYQTYYGLKVGDIVTEINQVGVATFGDYDSAKGQLDEAFQRAEPLTVLRDGKTISLPVGGGKSQLDQLLGH